MILRMTLLAALFGGMAARAEEPRTAPLTPQEIQTLRATVLVLPTTQPTSMVSGNVVYSTTQPSALTLTSDGLLLSTSQPINVNGQGWITTLKPTRANGETVWLMGQPGTTEYGLSVGAAGKRVQGAYLGVGVEAPGEALRAQLKLPPGVGLIVNYVDEHSAAHGAVHQHDVIEKLDDQLIVNGEQLVTLIRLHKAGDSVKLTLIRESRRETVDVKLGEKDVPALETLIDRSLDATTEAAWNSRDLAALELRGAAPTTKPADRAALIRRLAIDLTGLPPSPKDVADFMNDKSDDAAKRLVDRLVQQPQFRDAWTEKWTTATTQPAGQASVDDYIVQRIVRDVDAVARASHAGPVTIDDGEVLMWVQQGANGTELTVVDRASGKVKFKGAIGTEEQWKAVPEDVRNKFETWKSVLERSGEKK